MIVVTVGCKWCVRGYKNFQWSELLLPAGIGSPELVPSPWPYWHSIPDRPSLGGTEMENTLFSLSLCLLLLYLVGPEGESSGANLHDDFWSVTCQHHLQENNSNSQRERGVGVRLTDLYCSLGWRSTLVISSCPGSSVSPTPSEREREIREVLLCA